MSREVCLLREGAGTKRALEFEVREERWHDLGVIATVVLFAKGLMLEGMGPSGVAAFLMGVELVKFVGRERCDTEEGVEEDLRVFVVSRENRIDGERGERDVDNGQCGVWVIFSRSEAVDDGGIEFVCVGEVEIEAAAIFEPLGAQGTLVEAAHGVEDEGVILEFAATGGGEGAVCTVERWQERRHILV